MKTSLSIENLFHLQNKNLSHTLIDVRNNIDYNNNHIPGAINIPIEDIETIKFTPNKENIIITVCGKGGGRSEKAAQYLRDHFTCEVYFLEGGTNEWFENKKIIEK